MGFWTKIKQSFKGENILYYPGCLSEKLLKDQVENYKTLLHKTGISFLVLPELKCCGSLLLDNGYDKEFYDIINKNKKILEKHAITKIITNCPRCVEIFNNYYNIKTEHISGFLINNLGRLRRFHTQEITLINSNILDNIIGDSDSPKKLLIRAGYMVKEFNNIFCGAGGGLLYNNPNLADALARKCLDKVKTKNVVVVDPFSYLHLKRNNKKKEKKIIEFSDALIQE